MRIPLWCCCTVTLNSSLPGFLGPYLYQELTRILLFFCKPHENYIVVSTINLQTIEFSHFFQATERYQDGPHPVVSPDPSPILADPGYPTSGDRRAASALACAHRSAAHDGAHGATSGLAAGRRSWGFGRVFLMGKRMKKTWPTNRKLWKMDIEIVWFMLIYLIYPFLVDEQKPKPTGKLTVCYDRNSIYSWFWLSH